MMNKKVFGLLFIVFLFGYFLRVMFLPSKTLTFGYDQARDAVNALEIIHGHIKIFGPPASQPGLFHGVFYYYVLAPFYLIGKGSPIIAAYGVALINALGVFLIFYLGYLLSNKKMIVGLIAAFLFAVSFEATQYATWLSNPTLGIITVPLVYLGLWMWISNSSSASKTKDIGPILAALGLGLSIQSEIFLVYHMVPLLIWLWIGRENITRRQLVIFGLVLLTTLSTMFLAQIKFGISPTIAGIKSLAIGDGGNLAYEKSLGDYLILYLNQAARIFSFNSYPGNVGWGSVFIIAIAIVGILKKDKRVMFMSTWLFSHLTVVTVGGTSTPFLMVGIGPAVSVIIALFLGKLLEKKYTLLVIIILVILVFGNLSTILSQNRNGATLFSIQKDMLLSKQISAIDYTYSARGGQGRSDFSINTLTSPLWVNIVWSYLYKWYGENKYGYVPTWHGRGQEGQVISLIDDKNNWNKGFLIIEPQDGIPPQYLPLTIGQEDSYSRLVDEKDFGTIRVQERVQGK